MIKLILYDLDGTLCDCCEWHYLALNDALREVSGIEINEEEHISTFNGIPTKKKLQLLIEQGRIKQEDFELICHKKQEYTKGVIKQLAKPDFIKIKLHRQNRWNNIRSVCVTNSITETAALILESTGQLDYMDFVISNECVRRPKPFADGFIKAFVRAGCYPEECIVVEDSPIGIQAAKASGANVWEVSGAHEVNWDNFQQYMVDLNSGRLK